MKTSFPTAPLIKCPSSMSSLRGSSCTTKQKVISGFTGNSSEPDACSALEQVPKPQHLGYGVKITSTLGFVTVKLPLNIFFNYVKGIVLREEHSSYSVASPCEASPFSPHSPTFCSKGYSVCVAGEEPPLAGALGCAPRNHGEHPCHRHPFLHGHEGKSVLLCSFCHLLHWHVFVRPVCCLKVLTGEVTFNHSCNFVLMGINMKLFCHIFLESSSCILAFAGYQ